MSQAPYIAPSQKPVSMAFFSGTQRRLKGQHVSDKLLLVFTSQLCTMLSAGCDLCASLESLSRQEGHPYLRTIICDLHNSVQAGRSFSQSLAAHPDVFSSLYVTMIRAGETAGMLRSMLQGIQIMLRNQMRLTNSIRGALIYPAILSCVALTAIIVMTTFVLPRFAAVFEATKAPLPTITRVMLTSSSFVGAHCIALFSAALALVILVAWILTRPAVRPHLHAVLLRVPLLGKTLQLASVVRSIQTMGLLVKAGLPAADAIELVADLMANVHYRAFFTELHEHIKEGKPLAPDFETSTLFPAMVAQMMSVGEQSGTLPGVCAEISSLHEEEMQDRVKILTAALEPAIIVFLGAFVGLIAVSVILPMFRLSAAIK
jgi:type IV pilus assembly protein PilC